MRFGRRQGSKYLIVDFFVYQKRPSIRVDRGARAGSENGHRVAGVDRLVRAEDRSACVAHDVDVGGVRVVPAAEVTEGALSDRERHDATAVAGVGPGARTAKARGDLDGGPGPHFDRDHGRGYGCYAVTSGGNRDPAPDDATIACERDRIDAFACADDANTKPRESSRLGRGAQLRANDDVSRAAAISCHGVVRTRGVARFELSPLRDREDDGRIVELLEQPGLDVCPRGHTSSIGEPEVGVIVYPEGDPISHGFVANHGGCIAVEREMLYAMRLDGNPDVRKDDRAIGR